jgi:hypothetical protein
MERAERKVGRQVSRLAGRQLAAPCARNDKAWAQLQVAVSLFMLRPYAQNIYGYLIRNNVRMLNSENACCR